MSRMLAILVLTISGCVNTADKPDVKALEQFLAKDPLLEAEKSLKQSPVFVSVRVGYFSYPGVEANYPYCYRKFADHIVLNAGSDVIESEKQMELIKKVKRHAEVYNQAVAKGLDLQGKTVCEKGLDWGAILSKISIAFEYQNANSPTEIEGRAAPLVSLKPKELIENIGKKVCDVLVNNKVSKQNAYVAVDDRLQGKRNDFKCFPFGKLPSKKPIP